jgi:excisionase family DNA binding protein
MVSDRPFGNDSGFSCPVWHKKCTAQSGVPMAEIRQHSIEDKVLTTKESCSYLRITKPTFLKYIGGGRIKAIKAGKGWKVLKSELDRFLRGD